MQRYLLVALVLFFFIREAYGQADTTSKDSLVFFRELTFLSTDQQNSFRINQQSSDVDFLKLAIVAHTKAPTNTIEWYIPKYESLTKELELKKFAELKPEKKIKLLYATVHEKLLKKYSEKAVFEDIFISGNYNCVTASMLYGILLHHFNIPFDIKETTTHVYIVAKIDTKSLLIESTDPVQGYVSYNQTFKEKFIEYLLDMKMIVDSDIRNEGIDSLFQKYYFTESNIGLKELGGIQYCNNAIFMLAAEDYKTSLDQLQKSYFLYPSEKARYLLRATIANLLTQSNYQEETDWKYFAMFTRYKSRLLNIDAFKDEFNRLTSKILVEKSNLIKYQAAYEYINSFPLDSAIKSEIGYIYNYEVGRYYIVTGRLKDAFPYIEAAYKLNDQNYQLRTFFIESFIGFLQTTEEEEGMELIEKYLMTYESLQKDERISRLMSFIYLAKANSLMDARKPEEGESYLQKFEGLITEGNKNASVQYEIEETYNRFAAYYFKLNNTKKAREYLNRGLKYYPESYRLKSSLDSL